MRIRVYFDRTDRKWRVVSLIYAPGASPVVVAEELQRRRRNHETGAGIGFPTWASAMAAADRMATRGLRQAWLRDEYPTGILRAVR